MDKKTGNYMPIIIFFFCLTSKKIDSTVAIAVSKKG